MVLVLNAYEVVKRNIDVLQILTDGTDVKETLKICPVKIATAMNSDFNCCKICAGVLFYLKK